MFFLYIGMTRNTHKLFSLKLHNLSPLTRLSQNIAIHTFVHILCMYALKRGHHVLRVKHCAVEMKTFDPSDKLHSNPLYRNKLLKSIYIDKDVHI